MLCCRFVIPSIVLAVVACSSSVPPCDDTKLDIDGVTITAEGRWYIYGMAGYYPEGAPFSVFLNIYVENASGADFNGFRATKITLYLEHTDYEIATLDLEPDSSIKIPGGVTDTLKYRNADEFSSNVSEGTMLYGCIDVEWEGGDDVLGTTASPVRYSW